MQILKTLLALAVVLAVTPAQAASQPRTHDGFHFQLTGGLGMYDVSGDAPANQDFSGTAIPGSVLFGGTLFGRMAFGGGLYFDYAPGPKYELNGNEVKDVVSSQTLIAFGAYADYYLDPQQNGLHFQVFGGWGGLETSFQGDVGGSDPTGLVGAVAVGYDWWLSDEWSAGVMGRVVYAPLDLNGTGFTTIAPGIVAAITWH